MDTLLTIDLLGWNGEGHLEETAKALAGIPADAAIIRYIDNGSTDTSISIIERILPHADIIRFEQNMGFAHAHNAGIARCATPYVLTLDQDQVIVWDGIVKLLEEMQKNPKLGAVQGKLYRKNTTDTLDSAGIVQSLSFNGIERGANEKDTGQYNTAMPLSAVTGGCGLYRISALRLVAQGEEIFDEDFFAYKEDVDLGWRLRNAGWGVLYIPVLASYHGRTLGKRGMFNWGLSLSAIRERLASVRTQWSLRNYIWMIAKNASPAQIILHWPWIKVRLFIFFMLSLFSEQLFSVWKEARKGLKGMRKKGKPTRKKPS